MIVKKVVALGLPLALVLIASYVRANDIPSPVGADAPLVMGAGVIYRDKTYEGYSDNDKWQAVPLVLWEDNTFFVRGTSAGWKAWTNESWELAVLAEFRGDGYDSGDADILAGMDDRDRSLDGGAHIAWRSGRWGVKATWVHDLLNKHEGHETRGEASYTYTNGHWTIKPTAAVVFQSDDLVDYYYGVEVDEAVAGFRDAYSADSEVIYRLQTSVAWNPGGSRWQLLFGGRVDFQGDEFDNSTITDEDTFFLAFLAAGYRF